MAFFTKGFIEYFEDLRINNNREWFQANKSRYIEEVKQPFEDFIAHMIEYLKPEIPNLLITPKDAIFRIYRDVRFSKDKTPYKDHAGAILSSGGKKSMNSAGLYLQASDSDFRIYSGVYKPQKEQLLAIREKIAINPEHFNTLYSEKKFKKLFGEIKGEKNKRLPKDLREAAETEPLIYNKGFYFFNSLKANTILKKNLPEIILEHYQVVRPLNDFFEVG